LLDAIRLNGANRELVDEVVRLATRYAIITPYTSGLILEDQQRPVADRIAPASPALAQKAGRAAGSSSSGGMRGGAGLGGGLAGPAVGRRAVEASKDVRSLRSVGYVGDDATEAAGKEVVRVAGATFLLEGDKYVDTRWDGKTQPRKIV